MYYLLNRNEYLSKIFMAQDAHKSLLNVMKTFKSLISEKAFIFNIDKYNNYKFTNAK